MALKIFKALWFLSMLAVMANLLYVYASLPEEVSIREQGIDFYKVGRDQLFYIVMTVIALSNVVVYMFSKKVMPQEDFRAWLHGFVITLNIFFIIGLSFTSLYNSNENYDFSRIGFIIYSSVGLVVLWAISWPIYLVGKKFIAKQAV
ncbi:MAG TPA: hypothetical protein VGK39_06770 [Cyclobacteriaceae bacterium]